MDFIDNQVNLDSSFVTLKEELMDQNFAVPKHNASISILRQVQIGYL